MTDAVDPREPRRALAVLIAVLASIATVSAASATDPPVELTRSWDGQGRGVLSETIELTGGLYRVEWIETSPEAWACDTLRARLTGPDGRVRVLFDDWDRSGPDSRLEREVVFPVGPHELRVRWRRCPWTLTITRISDAPPRPALRAPGGASLVADLPEPPDGAAEWDFLGRLDDVVLLRSFDPDHGWELWRTDGSAEGTHIVRDIRPGSASSNPTALGSTDQALYLLADDGIHGRELWSTDGTTAGTQLVRDIRPGERDTKLAGATIVDEALWFAVDGHRRRDLWRSDGTKQGTRRLTRLPQGMLEQRPDEAEASRATVIGPTRNGVFFTARNVLWASDGTKRGTWRIGGSEADLVLMGDRALFTDPRNDRPWVTSGTRQGTRRLGGVRLSLRSAAVAGERLYFIRSRSEGDVDQAELWVTDATVEGTRLIAPLGPDPSSGEGDLPMLGTEDGRLFLLAAPFDERASIDAMATDLWVSDGTAEGTRCIAAFERATLGVAEGDGIVFVADDGAVGPRLWMSDGSPEGTRPVTELLPGLEGRFPVLAETADFPAHLPSDTFLSDPAGRTYFFAAAARLDPAVDDWGLFSVGRDTGRVASTDEATACGARA